MGFCSVQYLYNFFLFRYIHFKALLRAESPKTAFPFLCMGGRQYSYFHKVTVLPTSLYPVMARCDALWLLLVLNDPQ